MSAQLVEQLEQDATISELDIRVHEDDEFIPLKEFMKVEIPSSACPALTNVMHMQNGVTSSKCLDIFGRFCSGVVSTAIRDDMKFDRKPAISKDALFGKLGQRLADVLRFVASKDAYGKS